MFRWPLLLLTFVSIRTLVSACTDEIQPSNEIAGCTWEKNTTKDGCVAYKLDCQDPAIDEGCLLDPQPGPCSAKTTKYYYDTRSGKCSPFIYGGCSGNENNFDSLGDCQDICINGKPRKRSDSLNLSSKSGDLNCTGKNEEAIVCGACDQYCDSSKSKVCSLMCGATECGCRTGYLRNADNECVTQSECTSSGRSRSRARTETTASPTVGVSLSTLIAQEIRRSQPTTSRRPPRTRPTTVPTTTLLTTLPTTTTLLTTLPTTTTTSTTSTTTTLRPSPPTLPSTSTAQYESTISFRNPCDSINCPSYATCTDSVCVPNAGSNCHKLRLAVPPAGCRYNYTTDKKGCETPSLVCDDLQCGENEEVKPCGACDPTCGAPVCITSSECGAKQCGCLRGFVRNANNQCVQLKTCPAKKKKSKQ
ncbi:unnamed protein product [Bursaphelenchus xylophilus]|uniref:(pine wood nematode) hypothetical protein n=1 Tax=Bursaphelenchus xylophilus TaxID=6326 RepID=A0A1I7SR36_BURXY|nr:unnamed protein product [Bursaphelenchus xylophilus]CAG9110779.1 unnamed protein product [Bursaphelenchus xylophilus]